MDYLPINNDGPFCYIISALQASKNILIDFYNNDEIKKILIHYHIIHQHVNLFKTPDSYNESINEFYGHLNITNDEILLKHKEFLLTLEHILKKEHLNVALFYLLYGIINKTINKDIISKDAVSITDFIKFLLFYCNYKDIDNICDGGQNDANEFLLFLFDKLEIATYIKIEDIITERKKITDEDTLSLIERINLNYQDYKIAKKNSIHCYLNNLIDNIIINLIQCISCGHKHISFSNMPIIFLHKNKSELTELINDYFMYEEIEFKCDKCKETNINKMIKKIIQSSPYLILGITDGSKNKLKLSYELELNTVYLKKNDSSTYKLHSVINHYGSLLGGHYTSTIISDDHIVTLNDEHKHIHRRLNTENNNLSRFNNASLLIYKLN
jgi:ubiquitin C-terminal hydrolase